MDETIKRLKEQLGKTWHAAKALLDAAEEEGRALSAEEEQSWQRMNQEMDELEARIERLEELRRRERAADPVRRPEVVSGEGAPDPEAEALRRFLRGETREYEVSLKGLRVVRQPSGLIEVRTLQEGTAGAGGALVPRDFRRQLYEHLIEDTAIRQTNVTVLTTDSGAQLLLPKTTAHPGATLVTEGSAIPAAEPTFAQATLDAYKYGVLVQVSRELIDDEAVDIVGYLARRCAEALANRAGKDYITGTGTNQPRGVLVNASVGVTGPTGAGGAPAPDNIIDLAFSVLAPYRNRAFWLLSSTALSSIRKMKDSTNQYIWQPGLAGSVPNTILDRPYVVDPNMPAVAVGATSIAFGDFSGFVIRDVATVRFERSDDYAFGQDLVTFRALLRTDSDYLDETGAIKVFRGGTA